MRKITLFLLPLLSACATTKNNPNYQQALSEHKGPFKIFGIGRYNSTSQILTLIDADNMYFTIEAPIDTNYKTGKVYPR